MLLCSVVCVTECDSCGPAVNPFIFKKQMGHARLEINNGQISDSKTIGQKLDNYDVVSDSVYKAGPLC